MNSIPLDNPILLNFYDTIFENSQSGMFISKWDGTLIQCNSSFYKTFGFDSKVEILNSGTWSCYENKEERNRYLNILDLKGAVKNYVLSAIDKRGNKILYELNSNLIELNDEKYIVGNIIEFNTEVKATEEAYNKKIYQDLFENSL